MGFSSRNKFLVDTKMDLQVAMLEPASAKRCEMRGFGYLGNAKQAPIKRLGIVGRDPIGEFSSFSRPSVDAQTSFLARFRPQAATRPVFNPAWIFTTSAFHTAGRLIFSCWRRISQDMNDDSTIIAANAAFYNAFAAGDVTEVTRLWAEDDGISCIHPGWPAIIGRSAVLGSWSDILNGGLPRIVVAEPRAITNGDSGWVVCIEIVDGTPFAATNHFRRIAGAWRLVHHQASPIAQIDLAQDATADDLDPNRRIH